MTHAATPAKPELTSREKREKALRLRRAAEQVAQQIKLGTIPRREGAEKRGKLLLAAAKLAPASGTTEWHRRLEALRADGKVGWRTIAARMGHFVSHMQLTRYVNGSIPGDDVLEVAEAKLGIPRDTIFEDPREPEPVKAVDVVAGLALDWTFHRFVTEGPLRWKLSPAQSAVIKVVFDKYEPADLEGEERRVARILFGDVDEIPPLARRIALLRLGRRSGKTSLSALYLVWALNTCDLSVVGPEEVPHAICFSKNETTARKVFGRAKAILRMMGAIKDGTKEDNEDQITFARPVDGRLVRLEKVSQSSGGINLLGDWIVAAVIDEAERMSAAKRDAVIVDEDQIDAMSPTMTPGAIIVMISTPWNAGSFMTRTFDEDFGAPKIATCAKGPSLLMRPGNRHLTEERAAAMAKNVVTARREYDVEPTSGDSALIDPKKIQAAVVPWLPATKTKASAGTDLAFSIDWAALVVVERWGDKTIGEKVVVTLAHYDVPKPGDPFEPTELCADYGERSKAAGARYLMSDTHGFSSLEDATAGTGVLVACIENHPEEVGLYVRDLILDGKLIIPTWLPNREELVFQLTMLEAKEKPGGGIISVKRRLKGHGHLDLAAALEAAVWADRRHGPVSKLKRERPDAVPTGRGVSTGFDRNNAFAGRERPRTLSDGVHW